MTSSIGSLGSFASPSAVGSGESGGEVKKMVRVRLLSGEESSRGRVLVRATGGSGGIRVHLTREGDEAWLWQSELSEAGWAGICEQQQLTVPLSQLAGVLTELLEKVETKGSRFEAVFRPDASSSNSASLEILERMAHKNICHVALPFQKPKDAELIRWLGKAVAEYKRRCGETRQKLESERRTWEKERAEQSARLKAVEEAQRAAEEARLREHQEELELARADGEEANARLLEFEEANEELKEANDRLHESVEQWRERCEEVEAELAEVTRQHDVVVGERDELASQQSRELEEKEWLLEEKEEAVGLISDLIARKNEHKAEAAEAKEQRAAEVAELRAALESAGAKAAAAEARVLALEAESRERLVETERLAETSGELSERVARLEKELKDKEAAITYFSQNLPRFASSSPAAVFSPPNPSFTPVLGLSSRSPLTPTQPLSNLNIQPPKTPAFPYVEPNVR